MPRVARRPPCPFPTPAGLRRLLLVDDAPETLRETGYVLVGLGVLWFQRAQVLRRELARDLPDLREPVAGAVRGAVDVLRSVLTGTSPSHPRS